MRIWFVFNQENKIAANARTLVEREYAFEAAVERYRKIFEDLLLVEKYGEE